MSTFLLRAGAPERIVAADLKSAPDALGPCRIYCDQSPKKGSSLAQGDVVLLYNSQFALDGIVVAQSEPIPIHRSEASSWKEYDHFFEAICQSTLVPELNLQTASEKAGGQPMHYALRGLVSAK